ncbi:ABC transporter ATP-binding protein [Rhodohalobacter halophilus]|uniref:ABC transporter ATP-binding protein n=1 Tax=Rhodohalobacter halophilus TaxID=1812810 RepID=UPI00083F7C48|nr:ABC transporter ATP-binding protein [Rhodohalobacter halophilus]
MIEVQATGISKNYGKKRVLKEIQFQFQSDVIGIAGSNGSGKSTLLKILSGLLKPTSGTILWKLNNAEKTPQQIHPFLGFTAPYVQLYEEFTVEENVRFLIQLQKNSAIEDINKLLSEFQLDGISHSLYGNLSTGQQQRAKLACAMIKDPEILMLDEPGSNLDEHGKSLIRNLTDSMREKNRMVIIASNQGDELDLCNEIINLNP